MSMLSRGQEKRLEEAQRLLEGGYKPEAVSATSVLSGKVRPYFFESPDSGEPKVCFMCVSCEDLFEWKDSSWTCRDCEFVFYSDEAVALIDQYVGVMTALRDFLKPRRGRLSWVRRLLPR